MSSSFSHSLRQYRIKQLLTLVFKGLCLPAGISLADYTYNYLSYLPLISISYNLKSIRPLLTPLFNFLQSILLTSLQVFFTWWTKYIFISSLHPLYLVNIFIRNLGFFIRALWLLSSASIDSLAVRFLNCPWQGYATSCSAGAILPTTTN